MTVTTSLQKKLLLGIIAGSACLLLLTISFNLHKDNTALSASSQLRPLPPDVDRILEGYRHTEKNSEYEVSISGKRIVSRGRKLLGLRSNLVKSNFFQSIEGKLRTAQRNLAFAASDAEWDAQASHPLILRENVALAIDGDAVRGVKFAKLYFKQGVLEIQAGSGNRRIDLFK